jgi:hypothetical protein
VQVLVLQDMTELKERTVMLFGSARKDSVITYVIKFVESVILAFSSAGTLNRANLLNTIEGDRGKHDFNIDNVSLQNPLFYPPKLKEEADTLTTLLVQQLNSNL